MNAAKTQRHKKVDKDVYFNNEDVAAKRKGPSNSRVHSYTIGFLLPLVHPSWTYQEL